MSSSERRTSGEMNVRFQFRSHDAFGQSAPVVFDEPVLPFQKIGDRSGLNPDLHATQAGQEQIHLPHQPGFTALAAAWGFAYDGDLSRPALKQSPALRHL